MIPHWFRHALLILVLGILVAPAPARAQTREPGFAIARFEPAEHGSDWFVLESLDFRGSGRFAVGAVLDWGRRPLVLDQGNDEDSIALIENQLIGHFGAAVNIADRLRLGVNLPVALYQNGQGVTINGVEYSSDNKTTIGDLRLGADLRLFGEYREPFSLAAGLQIHFPTGDRDSFMSDDDVRVSTRLLAAGEASLFVYAVNAQIQFRPEGSGYAGETRGTELFGAAAAGLRLAEVLVIGPELFGSTVLSEADAAFDERATPIELVLGAHLRVSDFVFALGAGPGLNVGLGTPSFRGLASIEWFPQIEEPAPPPPPPPPPPADKDNDGIVDAEDACPGEAGPANADPKLNGCPPQDKDDDGIVDSEDACPEVRGVKNPDPKLNGCPDADADGIVDTSDACPAEAGPANADPKLNGCPLPKDTDGDGLLDPADACPKEAGPATEDPKTTGCPLAHIQSDEIKILEPVKFATGSDKILPESEGILNAVQAVLVAHPEITSIEVRGYTDDRGADGANLRLSKKRAAAVKTWLTQHGIEASRVSSQGFGEADPIDTNATEEGRRNNRRVEFRILGAGAAP